MSFEPHIRKLYEANGELTAPMVLDSARPDNAPLHPYFEWDDATAAEEYRLEQARSLIRRVTFVVEPQGETPAHVVREFQVVTSTDGGQPRKVYRRVTDLTAEEREEVLDRMRRSIASLVSTYRDYSEFWTAIRELAA